MKQFLTLSLLTAAALSAYAGEPVLLDEDFSSIVLTTSGEQRDFVLDGWSIESGRQNDAIKPWRFYGNKDGESINTILEVGNTNYTEGAITTDDWQVLYTPTVSLDGDYKLTFAWYVSPMCRDGKYKLQVYACEDGQSWSQGTLLFDCLDKDMLRECGVPESQHGSYYLFDGWTWLPTTISLANLNGKSVKIAFVYQPLNYSVNILDFDNVKIEQFDAPTGPKAALSTYEYDFGNVYPGSHLYSDLITMTNVGTDGLTISSFETPAGFGINFGNVDLDDISLKVNEKLNFQLVYEPTLTTPASGSIVIHTSGGDVTIAVKATKQAIPAGGCFEGFEGPSFPPAGWSALKWKSSSVGIEGQHSAITNAYYTEENYLMTPRIDASSAPATITFTYMDVYGGEEDYGADTEVRLLFSSDGGNTWELVDTYNYEDEYDVLIQKSYSRSPNSDNCYWKWEWELTEYDSEFGANASSYYLDSVVLSRLYGSDNTPELSAPVFPADQAVEVFNRGVVLQWKAAQFATGYKLNVRNAEGTIVDTSLDANTLSYELPTLEYNHTYIWTVTPFNAKGDAEDVISWSFTTIQDPTVSTYPYTNGFEEFPNTGWNVTQTGKTAWTDNSTEPYDGLYSAYAYGRGDNEVTYLETPDFVLPADEPMIATFYWGDDVPVDLIKDPTGTATNTTSASDGISDGTFEIYVDGEWHQLLLLSDKDNKYWIRERIDLAEYAGKTVAFRWGYKVYNYMHSSGVGLDNFAVTSSAPVKLSFSQEAYDFDKINYGSSVATDAEFTVFNDGTDTAEIASATFANGNFSTSLKAGDKIESGKALAFNIAFAAGDTADELNDQLTVTTTSGHSATMDVHAIAMPDDVIFFGLEWDENGSYNPAGLYLIDQDNKNPIYLSFVDYPHKGEKIAFMVIDYTANDWPIPYPNTGKKSLVTFGLDGATSKDWVVGPAMTATENSSFEFYGRNYESKDALGGGEVFGPGTAYVMVTTDVNNPSNLDAYTEVAHYTFPFLFDYQYTRYEADLSAYAGQRVRVGIRLESTDGLGYFLDDLQYNHFTDADFSGIADIAVDNDANAPVEYFNLQGVRVDNPTPGKVYIVRRGAAAFKQLFR